MVWCAVECIPVYTRATAQLHMVRRVQRPCSTAALQLLSLPARYLHTAHCTLHTAHCTLLDKGISELRVYYECIVYDW